MFRRYGFILWMTEDTYMCMHVNVHASRYTYPCLIKNLTGLCPSSGWDPRIVGISPVTGVTLLFMVSPDSLC